jgi:26S proteasome non-ATPase regulatory subunit 10
VDLQLLLFQFGCTPLHRAASTGNAELCEFLIEEGAEVDAVDKTGQTPLMHAVICENKGVCFSGSIASNQIC